LKVMTLGDISKVYYWETDFSWNRDYK
jgi:hypothetical protein